MVFFFVSIQIQKLCVLENLPLCCVTNLADVLRNWLGILRVTNRRCECRCYINRPNMPIRIAAAAEEEAAAASIGAVSNLLKHGCLDSSISFCKDT